MTTIGQILREARSAKKLSLSQVEGAIKIRAKFLEALENNQFDKLPPGTFAKGFIKNYATFLGVSPEEALAFYRRQVQEERAVVSGPGEGRKIARGFRLTPQVFTYLSVGLFLLIFFGYLGYSYLKFSGAPRLILTEPLNRIVVKEETVRVAGETEVDVVIKINEEPVTVSPEGKFEAKIPLQPGLNTITVSAVNKYRRETVVVRELRLER